jgi:hypothetical protein
MSHPHDQLSRYIDGELDDIDAEAFARHAAACAACGEALHDALQLTALEAAVRCAAPAGRDPGSPAIARVVRVAVSDAPAAGSPPDVVPLGKPPARGRSRRSSYVAGAAAASLALLASVWLIRRPPDVPVSPALDLATAPVRAIEGRISYAAADPHRRYAVTRATGAARPADDVPLDTLARLERRNDLHGVAAAYLLLGDRSRASVYLDRAAATADVTADRALVQLLAGHPAEALITLHGVLTTDPRHPQALWNRALALRDLGLTASAAEAFDAVAALGEPGWAAEAAGRARELSRELRERESAFKRLARTDGPRLAIAPDAVSPEVARRFPGMARLMFYDAVRGAASAEAVRALAPLAHTLDTVYGGDTLTSYAARIAQSDFIVRAPLAGRYAALVRGERLDEAAARALLGSLRAARADDILLGAILRTAPQGHVVPEALPELRTLCEATHDPWFRLLAVERAIDTLIARHDDVAAEAAALPALAECETSHLDYRCVALTILVGRSYLTVARLPDARRLLTAAADRARRGGDWYQEQRFLELFVALATFGDDVSGNTLPVARAYARELVLREPKNCELDAWGSKRLAVLLVNRVDLAAARAELAHIEAVLARCPEVTPDMLQMFVAAHVLRDPASGSADDFARLRAQIAHARTEATAAALAMLDQIEGRLLLDRDRPAGTALLERAIARAEPLDAADIEARKARSYAYSLLAVDAGRAGEWDRVWSLLGRAAHTTSPSRCGLGAAVEDGASVVVVRDAAGASRGVYDGARGLPAIDARRLVPADIQTGLDGCADVEVLARPPVQGLPLLLPDDRAWSYRLDGDRARPAPGASPARVRRLVIANTEPPASLGVARLLPWRSSEPPDVRLEGPSATPSRALAELAEATFVEIHSHGVVDAVKEDFVAMHAPSAVDATGVDASFLMLSPESDGRYALTAAEIRRQVLRGRPIVILAACHAAATASYRHAGWSLPAAFVEAGARAVIASTGVIDDDEAGAFFDDVRTRIEQGVPPAVALRDARIIWLGAHPGAAWVRSLMVFQ